MVRDALCPWPKILIIYALEKIVCKLILWIILKQVLQTPCEDNFWACILASWVKQCPCVDVARQTRISTDYIYIKCSLVI